MAAQPIAKQEALRRKRAIEAALRAGYPPPGIGGKKASAAGHAAKQLGVPQGSRAGFLSATISAGYEPDWSLYKAPTLPDADIDPIQKRGIVDALGDSKRRIADLERELHELRRVRQTFFGLGDPKIQTPNWALRVDKKRAHAEVPILFTSDFQVGEVVRSGDVRGWNSYSPSIFKARYKRLIEATIALCEREDRDWRYPGIVYLRGGDAISGSIHADLETTQDLTPPDQVRLVAETEVWGITELQKAFGKVSVCSVHGNHDRTTPKPRFKRSRALSFDSLALWFIEREFRKSPSVSFSSPESGDAPFSVFNTSFLLTHGDAIGSRGGKGFVGNAAPASRGMQKVRAQYASVGHHIDCVMMGHLHTPLQLDSGFVNGNLAGFTEYADKEMRAAPIPPSQWLLFVHPRWHITTRRLIQLEEPQQFIRKPWFSQEAA